MTMNEDHVWLKSDRDVIAECKRLTAEVERLTAEVEAINDNRKGLIKMVRRLEAERDRLRGALKKVTNAFEKHYVMPPLRKSLDIARAALAGEGDDNSE